MNKCKQSGLSSNMLADFSNIPGQNIITTVFLQHRLLVYCIMLFYSASILWRGNFIFFSLCISVWINISKQMYVRVFSFTMHWMNPSLTIITFFLTFLFHMFFVFYCLSFFFHCNTHFLFVFFNNFIHIFWIVPKIPSNIVIKNDCKKKNTCAGTIVVFFFVIMHV